MTLNDLQKGVLVNFSQFLAAAHRSIMNCDEMAENRPRKPAYESFNIKRRFFRSPIADLLGSTRPAHESVKEGYLSKKWLFYLYWLV